MEEIMEKNTASSDFYGYLFAHFIGEQENGEQIYFALSRDGMYWQDLNNEEPVLPSTVGERGVVDPFMIRSNEG